MHEWQGYETFDVFSSKCQGSTPHTAAKLTGGIQFHQVYAKAAATKRIIVGGASGTVGPVGGYIAGGGHSPFSRYYGMAVDQVLEFEVVTPAGESMPYPCSCWLIIDDTKFCAWFSHQSQ